MEIIRILNKTVKPPNVKVRAKEDIYLEFTFPYSLPKDSTITFRFRGGRNNKNDWYKLQPFDSGFDGYFSLKTIPHSNLLPMLTTGKEFYIQYLILDDNLKDKTIFEIQIRQTLVQSIIEEQKRIEIFARLPTNEILYVSNPPSLKVKSENFDHITVLAPSLVFVDEEFKLILRFEDKFSNPINSYREEINIDLISNFADSRKLYEPIIPNLQNGIITVKDNWMTESGLFTVRISTQKKSFDSNLILCVKKEKEVERRLFWGFIHGHTVKSDGMVSAEQYFQNIVDANLDFGTCSEHDRSWETTDSDFDFLKKLVQKYNARQDFVSFFGYEWGTWYTGGFGDICIYHKSNDLPILRSELNKYKTTPKLIKHLRDYKDQVMLIAHHTAIRPGFRNWEYFDNSLEHLVEIYSCWGNQERSNLDGNRFPPRYKLFGYGKYAKKRGPILEKKEGFVQNALMKGYKLGFTAGGDDHYGIYPSGPLDMDNGIYPPGILAVWAQDLTKDGIWKALESRKCYGTTGARIIVEFWINGHFIGDIIDLEEKPRLKMKRDVLIKIFSGLKIKKVEIIKNNKVFASFEPQTYLFKQSFSDDTNFLQEAFEHSKKEQKFIFYYVRIHLAERQMAWVSPIWIVKNYD
ncbi:MAG: DUF3604 domain-containing protein [Promethearchaeia archaeon]